jgi:hypothetical protein
VPEPDLLKIFVRPIHDAGFKYLVAGSVGSMYFSEPRLTMDINLAVAIPDHDIPKIIDIFQEPAFYSPPLDVLLVENARECRAHFNVIDISSGLKADFYPSQRDSFFRWAWMNRRLAVYPHGEVHYAPPEYIIVWKVAYFQEGGGDKHARDVRRIFEVSGHEVQEAVLGEELRRRGLFECYRRMLVE